MIYVWSKVNGVKLVAVIPKLQPTLDGTVTIFAGCFVRNLIIMV